MRLGDRRWVAVGRRALRASYLAALGLGLACSGDAEEAAIGSDAATAAGSTTGSTTGATTDPADTGSTTDAEPGTLPVGESDVDLVASRIGFHFPPGLEDREAEEDVENPCGILDNTMYRPFDLSGLAVDGFDHDGETTSTDGACAPADFDSPDGVPGIDYAFLRLIDTVLPLRPGQAVSVVLGNAVASNNFRLGFRISGLDDPSNDDSVQIHFRAIEDTLIIGPDDLPIPLQSLTIDPNPAFFATFEGRVEDGVLTAEADEVSFGRINLIVISDRVIDLTNARIRATISGTDGSYRLDGVVGGWWQKTNLLEAISFALLTIGANGGELECAFDMYADFASDGRECDSISTLFDVSAVQVYLTTPE